MSRRWCARKGALSSPCSWAGLGWAGLGWVGLGWVGLGWAGLGGVGWAGLAGLGWAGLGWAGWVGWAGLLAGLGLVRHKFGLEPESSTKERQQVALLLGVWRAARKQVALDSEERGERARGAERGRRIREATYQPRADARA